MTVAQKRKKVCLNLSLTEAKKVRELNVKADPSLKAVKFKAPNHVEYRDFFGEGIIVPDKGFTKQLKILDEELEVAWDWGSSKWEIWRFPKDGFPPFHVMTIQTKNRTYRELGADVLLTLQKGDPARFSKGELIRYLDELDAQERRRKMEDFKTKINDIALESFINIHCKIIQVPKTYSVGRAART